MLTACYLWLLLDSAVFTQRAAFNHVTADVCFVCIPRRRQRASSMFDCWIARHWKPHSPWDFAFLFSFRSFAANCCVAGSAMDSAEEAQSDSPSTGRPLLCSRLLPTCSRGHQRTCQGQKLYPESRQCRDFKIVSRGDRQIWVTCPGQRSTEHDLRCRAHEMDPQRYSHTVFVVRSTETSMAWEPVSHHLHIHESRGGPDTRGPDESHISNQLNIHVDELLAIPSGLYIWSVNREPVRDQMSDDYFIKGTLRL